MSFSIANEMEEFVLTEINSSVEQIMSSVPRKCDKDHWQSQAGQHIQCDSFAHLLHKGQTENTRPTTLNKDNNSTVQA